VADAGRVPGVLDGRERVEDGFEHGGPPWL
jgi:hypothetical protein